MIGLSMSLLERIKEYFTKPIVRPGTFWVSTRDLGAFEALRNPKYHQYNKNILVFKILDVNAKEVVYSFGYSAERSDTFVNIDSVPKHWFAKGYYTQVNYE